MNKQLTDFLNSEKMLEVWGPRIAEVIITNRCNLKCKMCNRWQWIKDNTECANEINLEKLKKLFSELSQMGVKRVPLSGGEPLVRADFIDIVKSIKENNMDVTVVNNGTFMSRLISEVLIELDAEIIFSLDGSTAQLHDMSRGIPGTWEKTIRGIKNAVTARNERSSGKVGINYVIQNFNAKDIYNAVVLSENLNVDYIRFGLVHGKTINDVYCYDFKDLIKPIEQICSSKFKTKILATPYLKGFLNGLLDTGYHRKGIPAYELFKHNPVACILCYQSVFIDSLGNVYPCTYTYFDNQPSNQEFNYLRNQHVMGNIYNTSFAEIWNGERYKKFRRDHNPVDIRKTAMSCGQCEHYYAFKEIQETTLNLLKECSSYDNVVEKLQEERPCGCFSNEYEFKLSD